MGDYREYRPKDMAAAILKVPNHSTIVDAEAQIDDTHGVAAVTVSATGTADNRTLHFRFTGLRGRDGDTAADEYDGVSDFPANGITGVIYIDTSTNVSYRWTGSGYVPIAMPLSMRGAANGLASLDQNGKVPSGQLPSYVDDVLEYANAASFPSGGESGKIYVALDSNIAYRWSGSSYVEISKSLALGETESTAYRGDRGREAYDHAQLRGSGFASGLYKIGTNSEGHVTSAERVSKGDITALGIPAQDTTYPDATQSAHGLMSAADKAKLDSVEEGANAYSLPEMSPTTRGGAKLEENGGLVLRDEKLGIGSLVQESDGTVHGGLAQVTARGHAEQVQTTGKNLLPNNATSQTINGVTFTVNADGSIKAVGTSTSSATFYPFEGSQSLADAQYVLTLGTNQTLKTGIKTSEQGWKADFGSGQLSGVLQVLWIQVASGTAVNTTIYPMLRLASITDDTYEPYSGGVPSPSPDWEQPIEVVRGHEVTGKTGRFVDLEVRDANDQLLSTTPIPLPSRGWVGSLPDGTADVLTLDGAGKVEWELKDAETTTAATDGITGTVGVDVLSTTGQIADGATVLYPLATPVIEDLGYIEDWPTDIPEGATITIPELDALGVKYFVDDSAGTLARQWYERASGESDASIDQRIELVESNIAMIESMTAKSNHAVNSYFMLDNVLRKATSAIASGEIISNSNSSPITVEQVITTLNNSVAALEKEVVFAITPSVSHRNIYRGKNLGTTLTTAQKAQIAAGTFDDLYVGDYWTINGRVYRIADIDYYYNSGDTAFTKHHLVIVPDASFGNGPMNDTNITTGAYKGSKMYTDASSVLNTARATIANDFGSALATHRIYLQNAVTNGYASAGEWTDSTVDLMNEPMVYGSYIFTPSGDGSIVPNRITVEKSQLALFRLNHRMINPGRYWYWLRDVVSGTFFAFVSRDGFAYYVGASTSNGVRPFFCIVGD